MASDDEEFWKEDAASIADREREQREYERTGMRMPPASTASVQPAPSQTHDVSKVKPKHSTAEWLAALLATMVMAGCFQYVRSCSNGLQADITAHDHVYNTASQQDRRDIDSLYQRMVAGKVVLKLEGSAERASLYVLPAFYLLNVDQKSLVLQVSYLKAFGLPKDTTKFSRAMSVHDGLNGSRIQTCDMRLMGVRWR